MLVPSVDVLQKQKSFFNRLTFAREMLPVPPQRDCSFEAIP